MTQSSYIHADSPRRHSPYVGYSGENDTVIKYATLPLYIKTRIVLSYMPFNVTGLTAVFSDVLGWKNHIMVTAYVVLIKNAAGDIDNGLLHPVLSKHSTGMLPLSVFSLPALQAVINFKWDQWASLYVLIEFIAYLFWLGFYTIFICLYQVRCWEEFPHH